VAAVSDDGTVGSSSAGQPAPSLARGAFEVNEQVAAALDALEHSDRHVFVTGRAGTGKSTLLLHYLAGADLSRTVVLAPTGVAALNVGGETIHHFFRMRPGQTPRETADAARRVAKGAGAQVYRSLDALVVDEVSMVRADLLDAMDTFLRTVRGSPAPFGGVRVIAFGDLYQLPPVVTSQERALFRERYASPYFFSSDVFGRLRDEENLENFAYVELRQIYRQVDPAFVGFLDKVRSKDLDAADLDLINARVVDVAAALADPASPLFLTTTNKRASQINDAHLTRLPGRALVSVADVSGDFPDAYRPTDVELTLKPAARVMLLTNDADDRWVNGSMGTVARVDARTGTVAVRLDDGAEVDVEPHTWEAAYNRWDGEAGAIVRETLGTFTQLPMRLAWAVTIHKAQGKTFDRVVVDFERSTFEHGQAYVALSRARSLDGLGLARPMRATDVRLDRSVVKFLTGIQVQLAHNAWDGEAIVETLRRAIAEGTDLEMVYLKGNNTRTTRVVTPQSLGEMAYSGTAFPGLTAYCHLRHEVRTFNVDRILELRPVP
jgi:hypothetical protein